jgi:alkyl sulfatase BDS1-like metallo-beta-lactamase superfamily hydrolase
LAAWRTPHTFIGDEHDQAPRFLGGIIMLITHGDVQMAVESRRSSSMYGNLLPPNAKGQVGTGLGTTTSAGTVRLIPPTDIIEKVSETRMIDELAYEFLYAPNSEAPTEMMFSIKEKKALNAAGWRRERRGEKNLSFS